MSNVENDVSLRATGSEWEVLKSKGGLRKVGLGNMFLVYETHWHEKCEEESIIFRYEWRYKQCQRDATVLRQQ